VLLLGFVVYWSSSISLLMSGLAAYWRCPWACLIIALGSVDGASRPVTGRLDFVLTHWVREGLVVCVCVCPNFVPVFGGLRGLLWRLMGVSTKSLSDELNFGPNWKRHHTDKIELRFITFFFESCFMEQTFSYATKCGHDRNVILLRSGRKVANLNL
jgi:hypothetical protein